MVGVNSAVLLRGCPFRLGRLGQVSYLLGEAAGIGDGLAQGIEVICPCLPDAAQRGRLRFEGGHIAVPIRVPGGGGPKRLETPAQLREGRAGSRRNVLGRDREAQGRQKRGKDEC